MPTHYDAEEDAARPSNVTSSETVMVRLAELAVALAPVSMVLPRALAPP
jgi:hypothetical protein